MTYLVSFLTIGLLLLIVLILWIRRATVPSRGGDLAEGSQDLTALQLELPPRTLVERIFAPEDWEFVSRQTPPQIQRMFLQERRAIALSWLRLTRRQAASLVDSHLRVVRQNVNLRPAVEIRLAFRYVLFLLESEVLGVLIWLGGPFYSRKMVGYAVSMAHQLSYISGQRQESIEARESAGSTQIGLSE